MPRGVSRRSPAPTPAPSPGAFPLDPHSLGLEPIPRVIQRSGASTLVVSLPKEWIELEGLRAGQFVSWVREDDGDLRLHLPGKQVLPTQPRTCVIRTPGLRSVDQARRLLFSAYVLGYDRVRLEDPEGLDEEVRAGVERVSHELLGFSLTEASRTTLVATSFLDPAAHPVAEVISRIGYTLDVLLERLEMSLADGNPNALQRVPEVRVEVRRLHALALRQLNLAAANPRLARQLGVSRPSHLLGTRVVAKLLDDIADAVEAVAGELSRIGRVPLSARPVLEQIRGRVQSLRERLRLALGALRSGSAIEAEHVLAARREALERFLGTEAKLRRMTGPSSLRHSLALASWWVGVARQHAEAVADVAFTRALDRNPSVLDLSASGEKRFSVGSDPSG